MSDVRIQTGGLRKVAVLAAKLWDAAQTQRSLERYRKKIAEYVDRSLMLATVGAPAIGYDKASKVAHHTTNRDLTLAEAALQLGFVEEQTFDRIAEPPKMVRPYVAAVT
jgi:fumarate hydratase class II